MTDVTTLPDDLRQYLLALKHEADEAQTRFSVALNAASKALGIRDATIDLDSGAITPKDASE